MVGTINKTALITGVTGQDGSTLADLLLEKGYKVVGVARRVSADRSWRIKHLAATPNFILEAGDITDSGSITRLVKKYKPDEFYNLAAQSFVKASWDEPYHTSLVTGLGVLVCLEAIRNESKQTRFYQASSSEMFGRVQETPQTETTRFYPRSPYGCAKVFGFEITRNFRESYGIHASNGILFNHEGPRRGLEFVTRKITDGAARIKLGLADSLALGNLDAKRDWGHAADYMKAAWLMLQQDKPDDYVVATGEAHSIRDLLEVAFSRLGLNWQDYVTQDPRFMRPAEVDILLGDSSKARMVLGWQPEYSFKDLIEDMVEHDFARLWRPTGDETLEEAWQNAGVAEVA
jgi:GDPmannose 4,6-dehydratase